MGKFSTGFGRDKSELLAGVAPPFVAFVNFKGGGPFQNKVSCRLVRAR